MDPNRAPLIAASAILALMVAIIWFGAPAAPAVLGAALAAALLYWRHRRRG